MELHNSSIEKYVLIMILKRSMVNYCCLFQVACPKDEHQNIGTLCNCTGIYHNVLLILIKIKTNGATKGYCYCLLKLNIRYIFEIINLNGELIILSF